MIPRTKYYQKLSILPSFSYERPSRTLSNLSAQAKQNLFIRLILSLTVIYLLFNVNPWTSSYYYGNHYGSDLTTIPNTILVPDLSYIPDIKRARGYEKTILDVQSSSTGLEISKVKVEKSPKIVIITTLDYDSPVEHLSNVINNRKRYAEKYSVGLFMPFSQDFKDKKVVISQKNERSFARLAAARQATMAFPDAEYFWVLDQNSKIMNFDVDMEATILDTSKLEQLMLRDVAIVRGSDIIKTFKLNKAEDVQLIITQDDVGLNSASFIFKNSFTSISLLDFWNDPNHRSYQNFDRGASSALNHIMQWHHTYLSRLAVVPSRIFAAKTLAPAAFTEILYNAGDFVITFDDCDSQATCISQFNTFQTD